MRVTALLVCAAVIGELAISAFASEPQVIGWDDLAPEPVEYDNPFERLTRNQMSGLNKLYAYERADNDVAWISPEKVAALRAELEADGLDIEWLFQQRRIIMGMRQRMATETSAELVGQWVRIPGYLLPLEMKDQKAVEFLLVPTVGACIHTPPPPANQMVHVRYPEGFPVAGLYAPIWVSGEILAEDKVETVRYVDGETRVQMSYAMKADSVEPY